MRRPLLDADMSFGNLFCFDCASELSILFYAAYIFFLTYICTHRYIDAWSARTTWGGGLPPVGCGDYAVDRECTDSVVIPEGQTVLLDISPPRFYLILVEGTLIFDRRDIELKVRACRQSQNVIQPGSKRSLGCSCACFDFSVFLLVLKHHSLGEASAGINLFPQR